MFLLCFSLYIWLRFLCSQIYQSFITVGFLWLAKKILFALWYMNEKLSFYFLLVLIFYSQLLNVIYWIYITYILYDIKFFPQVINIVPIPLKCTVTWLFEMFLLYIKISLISNMENYRSWALCIHIYLILSFNHVIQCLLCAIHGIHYFTQWLTRWTCILLP